MPGSDHNPVLSIPKWPTGASPARNTVTKIIEFLQSLFKGRTIRKVMGGVGDFQLARLFFSPTACAGIFFCR